MKILVTGGAGYVGSTLVARLLSHSGYQVTVIDNLMHGGAGILPFLDRIEFIKRDIRDIVPSSIVDYDCVVNLAALVGEPICKQLPTAAWKVNHWAAVELAKACEQYGKRLIALSTCSNYGLSTDYAREGDPLYPVSLYAKTKVDMENDLLKLPELKATILRCATAYGMSYRNRFDLMLQQFVIEAFNKKRIELFGAGYYRPICHVDDIARAIILLINREHDGIEVFNVGSTNQNYTKLQLAEMIAERMPCEIVEKNDIPDPRNYKVSFEKIKRAGFLPMHSLKETIDSIATALENDMITPHLLEQSVNVRAK